MKKCYSRFHFHVLDYCQGLRMPHDHLFLDCLVNKMNYGILHQLPATSGHIKSKQQTFTLNNLKKCGVCILIWIVASSWYQCGVILSVFLSLEAWFDHNLHELLTTINAPDPWPSVRYIKCQRSKFYWSKSQTPK